MIELPVPTSRVIPWEELETSTFNCVAVDGRSMPWSSLSLFVEYCNRSASANAILDYGGSVLYANCGQRSAPQS
jgi:hypothetical protein